MSSADTPSESHSGGASLTDELVIRHLKACQALLLQQAQPHFDTFVEQLQATLQERVDAARSNKEQVELAEQLRLLREQRAELRHYFLGYLGEGFVKFKRGELRTTTGEEKYQDDMLALVENDDLEETIAISSITHRAENQYSEPLWAMNQRLALLNRGERVQDRGNPAGPIQYCESLRKGLARTSLRLGTRILAYKEFDRSFIPSLNEVYEGVNDYLQKQGLLANLRYRPVNLSPPPVPEVEEMAAAEPASPGAATATPAAAAAPAAGEVVASGVPMPDSSLPSEQYQGHLLAAIRSLQSHLGGVLTRSGPAGAGGVAGTAGAAVPSAAGEGVQPAMAPQGGAALPGGRSAVIYSNEQLVTALQSIQTQALAVTGQHLAVAQPGNLEPQSIAEVNEQLLGHLQAAVEDGSIDENDMHTIDLVGLLFEYMLSDENLPDAIKALLSYLHTPFLKVAFIDKNFFEKTGHPARLLLNNMAEAAVKWVGNDGSSQYDIYDKIKSIVNRVLEEFTNDTRLFAELLLDFSGYTKKISRRQELMERRAMEKVQGEEKLREVKLRVNQEVRKRTDGRELPSAVLLMLLQPWSDYLAFLLLRYGEESESWLRAVRVIDEVLWTIEPKQTNADKTRQLEMQNSLLDTLESGFETIGYEQAKGKKLLEALFSLQKMALQSRAVEPASEPARSKLEEMAALKAGQSPGEQESATPEEQRMVEHLKMIEFGTWFEFEGGKRLKVAWYNSKTMHYMLVDQMGKKVAMMSGLELARAMLSRSAKVIAGSSKPFFERALENILQSLNARAEELRSETAV
ncbi:DUF1631 family protein [Pseudomaricurvus sp. HS19]|uniref:DUF1631 family protein n=1 Tax=Pseudomaricurvus sp. HS19 TaxID=2692626 RepID=UPI00136A32E6|nr:DUF1631 family protein [Pseudomaricurvus sp. HS19]MYM63272.1 DUF1631 family protein [Pseudomaricurvus sp. HS19]